MTGPLVHPSASSPPTLERTGSGAKELSFAPSSSSASSSPKSSPESSPNSSPNSSPRRKRTPPSLSLGLRSLSSSNISSLTSTTSTRPASPRSARGTNRLISALNHSGNQEPSSNNSTKDLKKRLIETINKRDSEELDRLLGQASQQSKQFDVNSLTSSRSSTLLLMAVLGNDCASIRVLLKHGAKPNAIVDKKNSTALIFARSVAAVKLLLSAGADLQHRNKDRIDVFINAVEGNNKTLINHLIMIGFPCPTDCVFLS